MSTGWWVLLIAVVLALGFGLYRAFTDGRFRGTHKIAKAEPLGALGAQPVEATAGSVLDATPWADQLGERGTLVQFSSAFCAPCRATRHILGDVAQRSAGVTHLDIDAEHHLDLVRRLGILRTPTTLVLDSRGVEVGRAVGAPRRDQVLDVLAAL